MKVFVEKEPVEVLEGTLLSELAAARPDARRILLAKVDGKIRELHHKVHAGDDICFLTVRDRPGFEASRRTFSMIFYAAVDEVTGEAARTTQHFSVGDGYFFTIDGRTMISQELCGRICRKMRELIDADLPIRKQSLSVRAARDLFHARGMADKEALFRTRLPDLVNVYFLGGYADYQAGFLAPRTGCITNTCIQVASNPTRIAIAVINTNFTCDLVKKAGRFAITLLDDTVSFDTIKFFGMQSGRNVDKFEYLTPSKDAWGMPYIEWSACAVLSAKVLEQTDLGSHTLFIAEVEDAKVLSPNGPLTYADYQSRLKPKPAAKPADKKLKAWRCKICGYVYEGENLPADFSCPLCGHGPEDFEPVY